MRESERARARAREKRGRGTLREMERKWGPGRPGSGGARERERGPTLEGARRAGSGGGGGGGDRDFSQREALLHVNEMLGGIEPHGLCGRRADLYVPLSNRFSFGETR